MIHNIVYKLLAIFVFTIVLSACGSSGSDAPTPDTSNEQNTSPTIPVDTTLIWNDDNWNTSDWK
jgi:hypothetical protein